MKFETLLFIAIALIAIALFFQLFSYKIKAITYKKLLEHELSKLSSSGKHKLQTSSATKRVEQTLLVNKTINSVFISKNFKLASLLAIGSKVVLSNAVTSEEHNHNADINQALDVILSLVMMRHARKDWELAYKLFFKSYYPQWQSTYVVESKIKTIKKLEF